MAVSVGLNSLVKVRRLNCIIYFNVYSFIKWTRIHTYINKLYIIMHDMGKEQLCEKALFGDIGLKKIKSRAWTDAGEEGSGAYSMLSSQFSFNPIQYQNRSLRV